MAASIAERGVLQPIIVRQINDGYELVAGERRWRAAQRAQLHDIPALIREFDEDPEAESRADRKRPAGEFERDRRGGSLSRLISGYGHSQEVVGKLVGKSRSHVANLLRLLELPDSVRLMLLRGDISMGHARAIATAPDPEALANEIVEATFQSGRPSTSPRKFDRAQAATSARRRPATPCGQWTPTLPRSSASSAICSGSVSGKPRQERRLRGAALQFARSARPDLPASLRRTDLSQRLAALARHSVSPSAASSAKGTT